MTISVVGLLIVVLVGFVLLWAARKLMAVWGRIRSDCYNDLRDPCGHHRSWDCTDAWVRDRSVFPT